MRKPILSCLILLAGAAFAVTCNYINAQSPTPTQPFGPAVGGASPGAPVTPTPTLSATLTMTATPLPTLQSNLMGIQVDANFELDRWAKLLDMAQFMGFKWIKIQLTWKELEAGGKGQFSSTFNVIRNNAVEAARRGFKIMLSVAKAPDWSRPASARGQLDGPPANPKDLVDFLNTVLDQYPAAYLNAIEIWNEPNLAREWTGAPLDGKTYMKYFMPAYQAIRARSGSVTIITAGPAPTGDSASTEDDRRWLTQVYAAGLPTNDPNLVIGVHPYGWVNPPDARCCANPSKGWDNNPTFFFLDTLYDYHQIMIKNGHAQGKLWATEFGWSSFQGLHDGDHVQGPTAMPPTDPGLGWMNVLTQDDQANYTVRAFQLAQSGDLAAFVGPMVLWNLNYSQFTNYISSTQPSMSEAGFSVLDKDWNPRPIYNLLQSVPKK